MKAYEFEKDGDAYRLALVDRPDPVPRPGRVIVRMAAASLNYRDLIHLRNKAGRDVNGIIPLSDGVGVVAAVGDNASPIAVGTRVAGCFFQTWLRGGFESAHHKHALGGTIDGVLAEYANLAAEAIVPVPEHLNDAEAACLPCAGVTAWNALVNRGAVRAGDNVLVIGTGGVSVFGLQFAAAMGCTVIVTSRSEAKLERASALGATHGIHSATHPEWHKEVARLMGHRGVDHILEVGGGGTLGKSLASVASGGHIALIGVLTGFGPPTDSLFPLVAKNATLSGIYVGSRDDFTAMNAFLTANPFRPVIDRTFRFAEAPAAFNYLETGQHFGKVVIQF